MNSVRKRMKRFAAAFLALTMVATSVPQTMQTVAAAEAMEETALNPETEAAESTAETAEASAMTEQRTSETVEESAEGNGTESSANAEVSAEEKIEQETAGSTAESETDSVATENADGIGETGNTDEAEETESTDETEETEYTEGMEESTQETAETEESKLPNEEDASDGETEMAAVTVQIPCGITNPKKSRIIFLQGFKYAVVSEGEGEPDEADFTAYKGSLEDFSYYYNIPEITINVPVNGTLYFKPVLKEKCTMKAVTGRSSYDSYNELSADADGIYQLQNVSYGASISMSAYRSYDVNFNFEHATVTALDADDNETAVDRDTVVSVDIEHPLRFTVNPDAGYIVRSVQTNSAGLKRDKTTGTKSVHQYTVTNDNTMKDPTTVYIAVEELHQYNVRFDYDENDAALLLQQENDEYAEIQGSEIFVEEGSSVAFCVQMSDPEKGAYLTCTNSDGITNALEADWKDAAESKYYYTLEGLSDDTVVTITPVDLYTVTFQAVSSYIDGLWTNLTNTDEYIYFEQSGDSEPDAVRELAVQIPAGYELRFNFTRKDENPAIEGTDTVTVDGEPLMGKWSGDIDEEKYCYAITPKEKNTVVTLDIQPARFTFEIDDGVEYTVYKGDTYDDSNAVVLSEENGTYYYGYYRQTTLGVKVKQEAGKRYSVFTTYHDYDEGYEYTEGLEPDRQDDEGYFYYSVSTEDWIKLTVKSYELTTVNFARDIPTVNEGEEDNSRLEIRRFYYYYDEDDEGYPDYSHKYWEFWGSEDDNDSGYINNDQVTVTRNQEFYFGVAYNTADYKLDYVSTTKNTVGNLEYCAGYYDELNDQEWDIYRIVPTDDMTIHVKVSKRELYNVTVIKGDDVSSFSLVGDDDTQQEGADSYDAVKENTVMVIRNIVSKHANDEGYQADTKIKKVTYQTEGGQLQKAPVDYVPDTGQLDYRVKITGDTTIYVDIEDAAQNTIIFENADQLEKVFVWKMGDTNSYENPETLTEGKITLANNQTYYFDVVPKDGYMVKGVEVVEDGKTMPLVWNSGYDSEYEGTIASKRGYQLGSGYGMSGQITVKFDLADAYAVRFHMPDEDVYVHSWHGYYGGVIEAEKTVVSAEKSFSFVLLDSNYYSVTNYDATIQESDSFTLTRSYTYDYENDERFAVYTITPKDGNQAVSATVSVTPKQEGESHKITFEEYPSEIRSIYLGYYNDIEYESYSIRNNEATVSGSSNVLEISSVSGYAITVTMTAAQQDAEPETLSPYRIEDGTFCYYLGEVTEDQTIRITSARTTVQNYKYVSFAAQRAVLREPEYKTPYSAGQYTEGEGVEPGASYYLSRDSSISFIVEPYYGYKVKSVNVDGTVLTPDQSGIYTYKPIKNDTVIYVWTERISSPVEPDDPVNPDQPEDPEETANITFTYQSEVPVTVTVDGYELDGSQVSVKKGERIFFKATLADEDYEIKSATADNTAVSYDESTGKYSAVVTADTSILITTDRRQEISANKYTVKFHYPQSVTVEADHLENGEIKEIKEGTELSFKVKVSGENYEVKSVTANGTEVVYNADTDSYILTVNADTEIEIKVGRKQSDTEQETVDPTQVQIAGVKDGKIVQLSAVNKYPITLAPENADASVLGIKVSPEGVIRASIEYEKDHSYLVIEKLDASEGGTVTLTIYNRYTDETISGGSIEVITESDAKDNTLSVALANNDGYDTDKGVYTYIYTGSAITPEVTVYYNGKIMNKGTDFTVKYSNNINASTDTKMAAVTITGKGSLTGNYSYSFKITPRDIGDDSVVEGAVKVAANAKATPVLVYNGVVLTKKDYASTDANKKWTADGIMTITGKNNFSGQRDISVKVVDKKDLNKISVTLDNKKNKELAYDGKEKLPAFTVKDAKKVDITDQENAAYIVVYPKDRISAGTKKFTVIGVGGYTGSITKTYKVKPSVLMADKITISDPGREGYPFVSTGVTDYKPVVTADGTKLTEGTDYTLTYSNHKKAGTAKCKVSFIGNYKGIKAITKTFTVNKYDIGSLAGNVIISDKISGGRAKIYKSVPYITEKETNALLKNSNFKLTYYINGDPSQSGSGAMEMKGSAGKISNGTVWVKIEPKNSNGNYSGQLVVSYQVRETGKDLSRAKVTFTPAKAGYTGNPITADDIQYNVTYDNTPINDKVLVKYVNNTKKGKATVIVTSNSEEYAGVKTASFTIVAKNIKN